MHFLETVARWAWETSIAASILIAPALLAAIFLRKPVFTSIRHMLGLLVVARLLMPFALPSAVSIFNFIPATPETTRPPLPEITAPVAESPRTTGVPVMSKNPVSKANSIVPIVWTLGVIAIFGRVVFLQLKVRRWTRSGNQITSGPPIEALQSALEASGCRRRIQIFAIQSLTSPALFGLFRPTILLPANLADSNDFTRLRLVCLHEIAHLKRLDVAINWFMIFAQTLHWFNPFVWLAMRRLRADQELLCDADVMRILEPGEHRAYGETLLALASPRNYALSTLIPVSSSFKQLKERIAMIKQFKPVHRVLVFTLPVMAALVAVLTFTAASNKNRPPTPAEKTNQPPRIETEKSDKASELLHQQTDMQENHVLELEHQVDQLRKVLKISYGDEAELHVRTGESIKKIDADRIRASEEHEQFARLLKELKGKKRSELRQALSTAYKDEALDRLLQTLVKTEQQVAVMQKDYTDDHPEVARLTTLLKTLDQQIETRIDGVINGLEALVGSKKAVVDSLNAKIDEAITENTDGLEKARPYFRAKRELETHERILDELRMRLVKETVDRKLAPR